MRGGQVIRSLHVTDLPRLQPDDSQAVHVQQPPRRFRTAFNPGAGDEVGFRRQPVTVKAFIASFHQSAVVVVNVPAVNPRAVNQLRHGSSVRGSRAVQPAEFLPHLAVAVRSGAFLPARQEQPVMRTPGRHHRSPLVLFPPFFQHSADVPCFQGHAGPVRGRLPHHGDIGVPLPRHPAQRFRLAHRIADVEAQQEFIFPSAAQFAVPAHQGTQFRLKVRARFRRHAEEMFFRAALSAPFQFFR